MTQWRTTEAGVAIYAALSDHVSMNVFELQDATGLSISTIRRYLKLMADELTVSECGMGRSAATGRVTRVYEYRLPQPQTSPPPPPRPEVVYDCRVCGQIESNFGALVQHAEERHAAEMEALREELREDPWEE